MLWRGVLHLVLVEPEIHWNTGNLGRTALAVGATLHLVEPLGFSLDDKQVRRAGLDYWPRVKRHTWPSWAAFAEALPSYGEAWYFGAGATRPYWDAAFADDTVLVFGRESVGLPRAHPRRRRRSRARHPDGGPRPALAQSLDGGGAGGVRGGAPTAGAFAQSIRDTRTLSPGGPKLRHGVRCTRSLASSTGADCSASTK